MNNKSLAIHLPQVDTTADGRTRITMRMADFQLLVGALCVEAVAPASQCDAERQTALAGTLVPVLPTTGQSDVRVRSRAARAANRGRAGA